MAILFHHHGGRADGIIPYPHKRAKDNPPPFAFFFSIQPESDLSELPQVSLYKFNGTITTDGDDTIWHTDFLEYTTPNDVFRFMRDHVSPDDKEW